MLRNDGAVKTDFLSPDLVLQLNVFFDGDTPLQIYHPFSNPNLTSPSFNSFLQLLGISPIIPHPLVIPHPLGHLSRPLIALARFYRWTETLQALEQPNRELERYPWPRFGGFLSSYSLHSRPLPKAPPTPSAAESLSSSRSISLNLRCRKWVLETFEDSRTRLHLMVHKKDYDISEVHEYLVLAAQRSETGDCPIEDTSVLANGKKKGGKGKPVTSESTIEYKDVENIVKIISEVLNKIDEYTTHGRIAVDLLKTAGLDDDDIASIIRKRPAAIVVMDLYRRKEIKYGWHWLRDWFPLWCVHKWDGKWLMEIFNEVMIETEGTTTAAKMLQKLCRKRCRETFTATKRKQPIRRRVWVWSDFENTEFYYV